MKRTSLLLLGLVAGAILAPTGIAYHFDGPKWPSPQVPFYVNPANGDVSEDAAVAALQSAAAVWSEQTNANVQLYYAGRTSGGSLANNGINEVFFRNATNGTQAAAAYYWYDGSGSLVDADMVIWDAAYQFFTGRSGCTGSGIYIEDLAAHEFGHFLGLHHSDDTTATMYPSMPAFCDRGWRELSADDIAGIEALYPATVPPPAGPVNLTAGLSGTRVDLRWSDKANDEQGFTVERSVNNGSFSPLAQLPPNSSAYTDTAAQSATTYSYRVRSWNDGGASPYSNSASVTTATAQAPAVPVNPSPAVGAVVSGNTVTLSWQSPGATSFDVYFGASTNPPLYRSNITSTSTTTNKLSTGVTYYWRVVAKNSAGQTSGPTWSFAKPASTSRSGKPGKR
jgi:hypothetical protein